MKDYTPIPTKGRGGVLDPTSVTLVKVTEDGELPTMAKFGVTSETLAKDLAHTYRNIGTYPVIHHAPLVNHNARFTLSVQPGGIYAGPYPQTLPLVRDGWIQSDITGTGGLTWRLRMPREGYLLSISVQIKGSSVSGNHSGGLPTIFPRATVLKHLVDKNIQTVCGQKRDPNAAGGTIDAYDKAHTIVVPVGQEVSRTSTYTLIVEGESGPGAVANALVVFGAVANMGDAP